MWDNDMLETARQAQQQGLTEQGEIKLKPSRPLAWPVEPTISVGHRITKVSFNQCGDIIADWSTGTHATITAGVVWLTLEQAYEAYEHGWRITENEHPLALVKVKRLLADRPHRQKDLTIGVTTLQPMQWEYSQITSFSVDEAFNTCHPNNTKFMGDFGWELVTIMPPQIVGHPFVWIYKRPKATP